MPWLPSRARAHSAAPPRCGPSRPPRAVPSLAVPSLAGTSLAGTSLAVPSLAGTSLAGTSLAGTSLAGTSLAGTSLAVPSLAGSSAAGIRRLAVLLAVLPAGLLGGASSLLLVGCTGAPRADLSITPHENDHFHTAKILVAEARYEEAARHLEMASAMRDGPDPEHDVYLAFCHLRLGDFSDGEEQARHYQLALEAAERASEQRPDSPYPRAYAGYVCLEAGQPSRSAAWYHQALELDPGVAKWHWNLGMAEHQLGNRQAALAAWTEAARLDPSYTPRLAARLEKLGIVEPLTLERRPPAVE